MADSFQDRVEQYLGKGGQRARGVRVVPLTGDASDRRYYRLIAPEGHTTVLAAYPSAFDETLPFLNVTRLLDQMPVPVPDILDEAPELGLLLLEDLGDVTLQAHLGLASSEDHGRLYREAVRLIAALQHRGAQLASDAYLPYGIAFDEAKLGLGDGLLPEALPARLPGRGARRGDADGDPRRVAPARGAPGRRAARAVPSRLPQPQPDAAQAAALPDRLPGCAPRPGHVRSRVVAARLVRRPVGFHGQLAARVLPGPHAAVPKRRASSASAST